MADRVRPQPPTGWRRRFFRAPIVLYRWRLGGLLGHRFVLIHHTGRTSGKPREVVVEVVARDPSTGVILVAAGFGAHSDWYQNLLAHPDARVELGWRKFDARAEVLEPQEAGDALVNYANRYPRAARRLGDFMGLSVDGTDESYRRAGSTLAMMRLTPEPPQEAGLR